MLAEQREEAEGIRPIEEIKRNVSESIQMRRENPAQVYKVLKEIGPGVSGKVYQVKRL